MFYLTNNGAALSTKFSRDYRRTSGEDQHHRTLNKANRYSIVYNLRTAKKEETNLRPAEKYFKLLERKEKIGHNYTFGSLNGG